MASGSLIVVGTGIRLAEQCTPEARRQIERAEAVYAVSGDPVVLCWLETLNPNTVSLDYLYGSGRARDETYDAMTEAILEGVRSGKKICAVFYGHPGVFVAPSHAAIHRARAEGFEARMIPAISSEDCLYADLGVDPGRLGCQSYEVTDFLIHARRFDRTAALILWQIAVVGDQSLREFEPNPKRIGLLAEILMEHYPPDHAVTIYEAATLPVGRPKIHVMPLRALRDAEVTQQSTLFIPPLSDPVICPERLAKLNATLG
jgi:uroporphyrin-III C-methyltransferase